MLTIGLAMLQGARHEHAEALRGAAEELDLDIEIRELRKSRDVVDLHAIVLPGGESTSMNIASRSEELHPALWDFIKENQIPVLGTCAGAILLCQQQLVDAKIDRNAFGRQRESFVADLNVELENEVIEAANIEPHTRDKFGHKPLDVSHEAITSNGAYPGVFIRAPRFTSTNCEDIAFLGKEVVGVIDGKRMALTFHPELTLDRRFHRWLLQQCIEIDNT
jgi:5'-phosphate synthase pdxT subunit